MPDANIPAARMVRSMRSSRVGSWLLARYRSIPWRVKSAMDLPLFAESLRRVRGCLSVNCAPVLLGNRVLQVLLVLGADVLPNFVAGEKVGSSLDGPGFQVGAWIVD